MFGLECELFTIGPTDGPKGSEDMGMTITEKIVAGHCGRAEVGPGEIVWVDVDVLMTHDVCGPATIGPTLRSSIRTRWSLFPIITFTPRMKNA